MDVYAWIGDDTYVAGWTYTRSDDTQVVMTLAAAEASYFNLPKMKLSKHSEINAAFDAFVQEQLGLNIPILAFNFYPFIYREYDAYNANPLASTPMLDNIVVQRAIADPGFTKADLVTELDAYIPVINGVLGTVYGYWQVLDAAIEAAANQAALDAIAWVDPI